MLWKAFGIVMACANCVLIAFLFCYLHLNRHAFLAPANGLEWKDFVSILLTALGVMLAVMTLFLAVLAIWGIQFLERGGDQGSAYRGYGDRWPSGCTGRRLLSPADGPTTGVTGSFRLRPGSSQGEFK